MKSKAAPKKAVKKAKPKKSPPKLLGPENPNLPQARAYKIARRKLEKNEILLYIYTKEVPWKFVGVIYDKKLKKRRKVTIKLTPKEDNSRRGFGIKSKPKKAKRKLNSKTISGMTIQQHNRLLKNAKNKGR